MSDKTNPRWAKTEDGKFHRLLLLRTDRLNLDGVGGVFVLWRGGLQPTWLYADKSRDLAADMENCLDNDEIMANDMRAGVFVSWALVRPEYQDGVLKYLLDTMEPLIEHPKPPPEDTRAYPVLVPGEQPLLGMD